MSSSVTALSAAANAVFNSFGVRGWRPRTKVLTFDQQFSIGESRASKRATTRLLL
jgi:hypothetical protein